MAAAMSLFPVTEWRRSHRARPPEARADSTVLVGLVRSSEKQSGRFVCDRNAWTLLLEVGVSFGWKQHGTTYLPTGIAPTKATESAAPLVRHDYQPGDSRDPKCIDNVDAIAWAAALTAAHRSPYLSGMLAATQVNASDDLESESIASHTMPFLVVMDRFTRYAFGGAFAFARAEER
jgi:hypothetical protein